MGMQRELKAADVSAIRESICGFVIVNASFLYPLPIAIVAGLIALPILIHLINLMRHRRVQWAAMEFLLVSQKRQQHLDDAQATVAAAAADGGHRGGGDDGRAAAGAKQIGRRCSAAASCTTSCCWTTAFRCPITGPTPSAFDEAKQVIQRLGKQAAEQPARQEFTLLRFSQASRPSHGTQVDLTNETVDAGEFPKKLEQTLAATARLATGRRPGRGAARPPCK